MPQFDFNTAASIPMIFATAYISLCDTAKLCKGQSILIHAATGGVGQAPIIFSQYLEAEVFATAGSSEKRKFITSKYGVPEDHVFSSREETFLPKLMSITGEHGFNVVLNCLLGKLLQESFNCLAPFGHFVEIGKFDL
jgi:NADPH:quinone reductase-like Zn-dependent oxidoreductase